MNALVNIKTRELPDQDFTSAAHTQASQDCRETTQLLKTSKMESCSRPGLCEMPAELLHRIFAEFYDISHETFRSLRQTCRRLVVPANEYLFHRIRLSSLQRDRDNFLSIAGAAHLACHARVLVWEEISFDGTLATDAPWSTLVDEYPHLAAHLKEVLWLPMLCPLADFSDVEEVAEFRPILDRALLAMPNLRTIVSEQMHPYRRLLPSRSSTGLEGYYPIPAHHLQRITHPKVDDADVLLNPGFFAFLVPAMSKLTQLRAEGLDVPLITHLQVYFEQDRFLEDSWPPVASYPYPATKITSNPFASLTHIDICMSGPWRRYFSSDWSEDQDTIAERKDRQFARIKARILGILQGAAASVTHLHLCRQSTWDDWGSPGYSILRSLPHMPRLSALHLDGVYHDDTLTQPPERRPLGTDEERATGFKESALVKFLRQHKATLRELYIKGTSVTFDVLTNMRTRIPELQLEKFEALPFGLHGNDPVAQTYVAEKDVLEFVNNRVSTVSDFPTAFFHEGVKTNMELATVDMDDDELEIETGTDMDRHFPYWSRCRPRLKVPNPDDDVEGLDEEQTWLDKWGRLQEFGEMMARSQDGASLSSSSTETELWEDEGGLANDPMREEDIRLVDDAGLQQLLQQSEGDTKEKEILPLRSEHRNDHTGDADLGLSRSDPASWHRDAIDRPVPSENAAEVMLDMEHLDIDPEKVNDMDREDCAKQGATIMNLVASSATASLEEVDYAESDERPGACDAEIGEHLEDVTSAKCRREYNSHLRRQQQDRGWILAQDEHGKVYYRPATHSTDTDNIDSRADRSSDGGAGIGSHEIPTEIWRFSHRNGEHAYGTEPLEYWSDWEGSQAGDTCEATPFGFRFWDIADPSADKTKKVDVGRISSHEFDGDHPSDEGWLQYRQADDFLLGRDDIWFGLPGPLVTGDGDPRPGDGDASYEWPACLGHGGPMRFLTSSL